MPPSSRPSGAASASSWSTPATTGTTPTRASPRPQDLDALDAQLTARGIEHEIRQPTRGRAPADELLDAADEVGATLIVIGLRRRSPLGKLITGSTAQQVLLDASCDVLAVKVPGA